MGLAGAADTRSVAGHVRSRLTAEEGVTLPEMIVTMAIGTVVLFAISIFVSVAMSHNNTVTDRVAAMDELDTGILRLQDDIRQAYGITPTAASGKVDTATLTLKLPVNTGSTITLHDVKWDCSQTGSTAGTHRCTRQNMTAGGGVERIIDDVTTDPTTAFSVVAPVSGGTNLPTVDFALSRRVNAKQAPVTQRSSATPRNCQTRALQADGTCQFP